MIIDFDKLVYPSQTQMPYQLNRIKQVYREVFLTENGRIVLQDIAQRGLLHTTSFTGTASSTDFNEGKRALALEIINLLNPNPIHNIQGASNGTSPFNLD